LVYTLQSIYAILSNWFSADRHYWTC